MPYRHPGTGEVIDTIPEQIDQIAHSGCWKTLAGLVGGAMLLYAGYIVVPIYWKWAMSFSLTPYPNLNGTIVTLAIVVGLFVLGKIGLIRLVFQVLAVLARVLEILIKVVLVLGILAALIYLAYLWLFAK